MAFSLHQLSTMMTDGIKGKSIQILDQTADLMLPSRAIRNVLFPTYEAMIMSLSHSSALLSEE